MRRSVVLLFGALNYLAEKDLHRSARQYSRAFASGTNRECKIFKNYLSDPSRFFDVHRKSTSAYLRALPCFCEMIAKDDVPSLASLIEKLAIFDHTSPPYYLRILFERFGEGSLDEVKSLYVTIQRISGIQYANDDWFDIRTDFWGGFWLTFYDQALPEYQKKHGFRTLSEIPRSMFLDWLFQICPQQEYLNSEGRLGIPSSLASIFLTESDIDKLTEYSMCRFVENALLLYGSAEAFLKVSPGFIFHMNFEIFDAFCRRQELEDPASPIYQVVKNWLEKRGGFVSRLGDFCLDKCDIFTPLGIHFPPSLVIFAMADFPFCHELCRQAARRVLLEFLQKPARGLLRTVQRLMCDLDL